MEGLGVNRRTLLARALLLVGASVTAVPFEALVAADADLLTQAQRSALVAAADTIMPQTDTAGAVDVGVPALFEGLLANWAAPATVTALQSVLDRIDALPGGDRHFAALHPTERKSVLQAFDAAALAPSDAPRADPFGPPAVANPDYQKFKELVLTLYYLSQPALTQELAYTHVPGRWEPSVPVTPATRPQGGPGMF